jgi:hypothetical protein
MAASYMRSVNRDAQAMSLGLPRVLAEIKRLESLKKKDRSVKKRLERLYTARNHLQNSTQEERIDLVKQLREINSG